MAEAEKNQSAGQAIQEHLKRLYEKNQQHLQLPQPRPRVGLSKMRSFLFIMGLILLIFLAFGAGFLTCFAVYPPKPEAFSLAPQSSALPQQATVLAPQNTYAARASHLQNGQQQSLLDQAQQRTEQEANQQARNVISRTLQTWSGKIRQTFGQYVGSALVPVTTGLAQSAVDTILPSQSGFFSQDPRALSNPFNSQIKPLPGDKNAAITPPQDGPFSTPPSSGKFSIQIQEFPDSQQAWNLTRDLKTKGFGTYVVRLETDQQLKFAVRVGQFKTYKDAREAASLLGHRHQLPARIVTIHPFEERLK